ncbi:hypothetical protein AB0E55_22850 [Amycolatopsis keratiniphila]|uniref:hypothetical protein n=1 Tax=Amycolatopsis keratiniphila TaxID=129921 RepID=UPI003405748C
MSSPPLVRFPAFRHHETARKEANNAMMALLVGAQVSAQFLELSRGSSRQLSEIFPTIAHIKRLNLRPDDAQVILRGAEEHLGAMAVPQALAIHEGFILDCLSLLGAPSVKAWEMHTVLAVKAGGSFDTELMCRFHVLREMRNSLIHRGGLADSWLVNAITNLTPASEAEWQKLAGRSPLGIKVGDKITLRLGELVLALTTTQALGWAANRLLITAVPAAKWAEMIIDDHLEQTPGKLDPHARMQTILGLQRHLYSAVKVTKSELRAAAAYRGITLR